MLPDLVKGLKAGAYRFVKVLEYMQLAAGTMVAKRGTARLEPISSPTAAH